MNENIVKQAKVEVILAIVFLFLFSCDNGNKESPYANLISEGYEIEYSAEGDLNNDLLDDLVLVVKKEKDLNPNRDIKVFLKTADGYKLDATSKTIFSKKYISEEEGKIKFKKEEIEIIDQMLFVRLYGAGSQSNIFSSYEYEPESFNSKEQILRLANVASSSTVEEIKSNITYDISEGNIKLEVTNTIKKNIPNKIIKTKIGGMGYAFRISKPEELISYAKNRIKNRSRFVVISENGLLVRERPSTNSKRIWQLPFNADIEVVEKTDIEFSYNNRDTYITTDGYWVKVVFNDSVGNKQYGYVFDGFLKPYEDPTIYREWTYLNNIDLHIHEGSVSYQLHGQCICSFPTKKISKTEIELIWDYSCDCVFNPGFDNDFSLKKTPIIGKPFAKYTLEGRVLKVTYFYNEWVNEYLEKVNSDTFPNQFVERYYSF